MTISIERATPRDAREVAAFAERTFRATFTKDNTRENLEMYVASAFGEAQQLRELEDPTRVCLIARFNGAIVAYALMNIGATHSAVTTASPLEIQRFYVDAAHHGQGLASLLMRACTNTAVQHRASAMWLGVWEMNPRAIRFYEKLGFVDVGSHTFLLGTDLQRDRVMQRAITPADVSAAADPNS